MSSNHLVNPDLMAAAWASLAGGGINKYAKTTQAFVPGGDPSMDPSAAAAGGGGGAPPPMPGGGGEAGAPAGGAPAAPAGGPPPGMDPNAAMAAAGGGGGGADIASQIVQQLQQSGAMGGGAGGMVEPIKPKIDVNVELMQIKKMLAKICDAQGIVIPASDMAVNSQDLSQMAMGQGGQQAGGGGAGASAIQPIQPMGAAAPGMGKTSADAAFALIAELQTIEKVAAVLIRHVADTNGLTLGKQASAGFNNGVAQADGGFDTTGFSGLSTRAEAIFTIRRAKTAAAKR
jgi:hypothetical protein